MCLRCSRPLSVSRMRRARMSVDRENVTARRLREGSKRDLTSLTNSLRQLLNHPRALESIRTGSVV